VANLARLIPAICSVLLGLAFGQAEAQSVDPQISYPTSKSAKIIGKLDSLANMRSVTQSGSNAVVLSPAGVVIGNAKVDVVHRRSLSPADVGRAVGKVAGAAVKAAAIVGVAVAVRDVYCELVPGGVTCDPGEAPSPSPATCYRGMNGPSYPSSAPGACITSEVAAATADGQYWLSNVQTYPRVEFDAIVSCVNSLGGRRNCTMRYFEITTSGFKNPVHQTFLYNLESGNVDGCAVGQVMMSNGLCTTGEQLPATDDQLDTRIGTALSPNLRVVVEGLLRDGIDLTPFAKPMPVTGPPSVSEAPKTTTITSPSGAPLSKTETTTHNITYNDNGLTWVTNTTINNYDGTTEVTEEKEELPECTKNPDSLNCAELDTPPEPELDQEDLDVQVTPDTGWGSDSAACPAPVSVTVLGYPVVIDNTVYCEFFSGIRPVVIAAFALAGALIFVGGLKQ
jgi:hypothetical protein